MCYLKVVNYRNVYKGLYYSTVMAKRDMQAYFEGRKDYEPLIDLGQTVVTEYEHKGLKLGEMVETRTKQLDLDGRYRTYAEREFVPLVTDVDASVLAEDLSPSERLHMRTKAPGLYGFLGQLGVDPSLYISDEDIVIHVADSGYNNLTELNRGDKRAWELVRERGLVSKLFPVLQPSD